MILTTGATEVTKVNNIYDMAGNLWEVTMEGIGNERIIRGGYAYNNGSLEGHEYEYCYPVCTRVGKAPNYTEGAIGFRYALYIKR